MSQSKAIAPVNSAAMALPEQWDRGGDMVLQFALHGEERYRLAATIAKGGLTHHKSPEAVLTIMLAAFEVGLPFMQALRGMYYVDGKLGMEGHLMDALAIQRCGVRKTVVESTRERCELVLHRGGWDDLRVSYDLDDAQRAGCIKGHKDGKIEPAMSKSGKPQLTWVKHTEEMLYWRCLSKGLKRIAPDFFGGIYTLDELEQVAEAQVVASSNRSTMEELEAAAAKYSGGTQPVEPDPNEMTEDEIDRMRAEFHAAVSAGVTGQGTAKAALDLAVAGRWAEARDAWDAMRAEVARAEADAEQGALPV